MTVQAPGPYLVTKWRDARVASQRAFVDIAGAAGHADDLVAKYFYAEYPDDLGKELPPTYFVLSTVAREMPSEGGRIVLPDGTVIEVEQTTYRSLIDDVLGPGSFIYPDAIQSRELADGTRQAILAAVNDPAAFNDSTRGETGA